MEHVRTETLTAVLDDLASIEIDLNEYYDEQEAQWVIDRSLTGKINTFQAFCKTLGWSEILTSMQEMTPLSGDAVESLEVLQTYAVPEARRLLSTTDIEGVSSPNDWFWEFVHPRVAAIARPRFEAGFFGDAVETAYKEVNDTVKHILRQVDGRELDGSTLMTTAFSANKPLIRLNMLETDTDRNIQQGFMMIMAGAMIGIRNPTAHSNLNPTDNQALHLICLASLLMRKIDERPDTWQLQKDAEGHRV